MGKRLRNSLIVAALLAVPVIAATVVLSINRGFRHMDEFSVLWETHDLVNSHVLSHGQLPNSWSDLSEYFDEVNRGYGSPDIEYLQERIDINFDNDDDLTWVVRVRSGSLKLEEQAANGRLHELIDIVSQQGTGAE